jgi:hypothetical protein
MGRPVPHDKIMPLVSGKAPQIVDSDVLLKAAAG